MRNRFISNDKNNKEWEITKNTPWWYLEDYEAFELVEEPTGQRWLINNKEELNKEEYWISNYEIINNRG